MSEATELLEHMEHAAHSGHGSSHGGPGKMIGITMAVLGVMLAICAALVGSQRTELIKTMVEQSTKWSFYQSETTKLRVMEADLEMLRAITPRPDEIRKIEDTLRSKRSASGRADNEDTAELKDLIASATEDMADLLTPDPSEKARFVTIAKRYAHDVREAKEDAEAYNGAVEAHQEAAEWYDRAQLFAEVGIVIASIALLLSSRAIWIVSILCGVMGGGIMGVTLVHTTSQLRVAELKIEEAAKRAPELEADDDDEPAPADEPVPQRKPK